MKKFNELTTVEEKRAAIKCGNLCLSATKKYRKGDETWNVEFQELMSILASTFGYSEKPFTIEQLAESEKEVVSETGLRIVEKASKK